MLSHLMGFYCRTLTIYGPFLFRSLFPTFSQKYEFFEGRDYVALVTEIHSKKCGWNSFISSFPFLLPHAKSFLSRDSKQNELCKWRQGNNKQKNSSRPQEPMHKPFFTQYFTLFLFLRLRKDEYTRNTTLIF